METLTKAVGLFVVGIVIILGLAALMAYPTKWLINYIFTDGFRLSLFGVAQIGFWRALAINALAVGLFKTQVSK